MNEKGTFPYRPIDLPPTEVLTQLAEEAAELAQASLKLRRAKDKTNPTPRSEGECLNNLVEELADVLLCCEVFCETDHLDTDDIETNIIEVANQKYDRWCQRLQEDRA